MRSSSVIYLWPDDRRATSIRIIGSGLFAVTGVWAFPPNSILEYVWVTLALVAAIYFYSLVLRRRKCGHGLVTQWGVFFVPWIVDPCPKCGAAHFKSDVE